MNSLFVIFEIYTDKNSDFLHKDGKIIQFSYADTTVCIFRNYSNFNLNFGSNKARSVGAGLKPARF
jgi:hypothetical protein